MNKPAALAVVVAVGWSVAALNPTAATARRLGLILACRARQVAFNDGAFFAAARFTVEIDPALGWTISYNQFVKRLPQGLTVIIARETGAYAKFDKSSHLQTGSCRTLSAPGDFGAPPNNRRRFE